MTRFSVGQCCMDNQLTAVGARLFTQEVHQTAEPEQVPVCLRNEVLVAVHGRAVQRSLEQGEIDMHQAGKAPRPLVIWRIDLYSSERI